MFDIGADKIVVVMLVALIVLGPGRLGEAARALGRARAQLWRLTSDLPPETAKLIRDPRKAIVDALAEPGQAITDMATAAKESVAPSAEQNSGEDTR